jgi:hypothetical protein
VFSFKITKKSRIPLQIGDRFDHFPFAPQYRLGSPSREEPIGQENWAMPPNLKEVTVDEISGSVRASGGH